MGRLHKPEKVLVQSQYKRSLKSNDFAEKDLESSISDTLPKIWAGLGNKDPVLQNKKAKCQHFRGIWRNKFIQIRESSLSSASKVCAQNHQVLFNGTW